MLVIYWSWNNLLSVLQQYAIMKRQGVKVELWDNMRGLFGGKKADKPAKVDVPPAADVAPSPFQGESKELDYAEALLALATVYERSGDYDRSRELADELGQPCGGDTHTMGTFAEVLRYLLCLDRAAEVLNVVYLPPRRAA